jgi:hypothetical protein
VYAQRELYYDLVPEALSYRSQQAVDSRQSPDSQQGGVEGKVGEAHCDERQEAAQQDLVNASSSIRYSGAWITGGWSE